ncbi:MAG: hypothetical protein ABJN26_00995 [Stappiaceae bacterium]
MFGSGPAFLDFFQNLITHCSPTELQADGLKKLGDMTVGVMGARSTSLNSWSAREEKLKRDVCVPDPNWPVNVGLHGIINKSEEEFVQIGESPELQFCKAEQSPFEAMFARGHYNPKLFVMYFLGKSTQRWGGDIDKALADVQATVSQIPEDTGCIFMTTAPSYLQEVVDFRLPAQKNLKEAFAKVGSRCSFVDGMTPDTIKANLGNKKFFTLKASGEVEDPYHPNGKAAENFLQIQKSNICSAVFEQLSKD